MTPEEQAEQWKLREEQRINRQQPDVIKVSISSDEMKQLIEQNNTKDAKIKQLETENASSVAAREMFIDLKEKAALQLTNLGIETDVDDIKTKEDLDRSITTIQKLNAKQGSRNEPYVNAGCVPLSSQTQAKKAGYGSVEGLVDDVNQNPEIRNALLHKCLKGVKEGRLVLKSYEMPIPETTSTDLIENGKLSKKPDVLGIQHNFRAKKLRERAKTDPEAARILESGEF
jgi:hypothetical protein